MRSSGREVVVGFSGMSKLSVGECCLDRSAKDLRCNYCGNFLTTVGAGEVDGHASRRQLRSRNHGSDGVENMMLRILQRIVGQRAVAGVSHIRAELLHDWADVLGGRGPGRPRQRGSSGNPGGVLQQTTSSKG